MAILKLDLIKLVLSKRRPARKVDLDVKLQVSRYKEKKANVLVAPSVCAGMDEPPVTTPAACPRVSGRLGLRGRRVESPVVWGCNSATGAALFVLLNVAASLFQSSCFHMFLLLFEGRLHPSAAGIIVFTAGLL